MAVNVCEGEVVGSRIRGGQGEEGFWTYSARLAGPADLENTFAVSWIDRSGIAGILLRRKHRCARRQAKMPTRSRQREDCLMQNHRFKEGFSTSEMKSTGPQRIKIRRDRVADHAALFLTSSYKRMLQTASPSRSWTSYPYWNPSFHSHL